MGIVNGLVGIIFIIGVGYLFSADRKGINWRTIGIGLVIQLTFALIVLKWPFGKMLLQKMADVAAAIISYANEGIGFLFGPAIPAEGMVFAFQVLTVIIFIASLVSVLYYFGVMQIFIRVVGGGLSKLLGTSQLESLSAAANIFLGQSEAPLVIKPYIAKLTSSELFTVMVGGLASVAGSVLVGYALMGVPLDYLIAASFMAAPAGIITSKLIMPEKKELHEERKIELLKDDSVNVIEAAAKGAADGLQLALGVGAMLLAFISLIAMINGLLGFVGGFVGVDHLTLELILGYLFYPIAVIIGVPPSEAMIAGSLIGQKLVVNEFVAYSQFTPMIPDLSAKATAIITFALCGFANISSLAILVGGIGGMAPSRKSEIAQLGVKAIIAGTLANLLSATIAGVFLV